MQNLNSILLEGNLLSDSRLVVTAPEGENWKSMVRFDLASHRVYRNSQGEQKDEVLIIACLAFGDLAERVLPVLKSGMQVRVLGRLRCSKWTTKDGDEASSATSSTENRIRLLLRPDFYEKSFIPLPLLI